MVASTDLTSQKTLWLHVSTSNNYLLLITLFHLNCISKNNMCPATVRMDRGNETIYCEDLQGFFHWEHWKFYLWCFHPQPTN